MLNNLLLQALTTQNPKEKCDFTMQLYQKWVENPCFFDLNPPDKPGFPDTLTLVSPKDLAKRSLHNQKKQGALLHAIAHIEFSAINLALDAAARFLNMPLQYYQDWLEVAYEEAQHFLLLQEYLQDLGFKYGDFPVHNSLWEIAEKTTHDVLIRMALVPRVFEARGIDVTPGIMQKFKQAHDQRAVDILTIIHTEEIQHVKKGSHWFFYLCEQKDLHPQETFRALIQEYLPSMKLGPFDTSSRLQAGFTEQELEDLLEFNQRQMAK